MEHPESCCIHPLLAPHPCCHCFSSFLLGIRIKTEEDRIKLGPIRKHIKALMEANSLEFVIYGKD